MSPRKRFLLGLCIAITVAVALTILSTDTSLANAPAGGKVADAADLDWMQRIDRFFGDYCLYYLDKVLFFDFWTEQKYGVKIPFIVAWLLMGSLFFTIRMGFINIRAFKHALRLTRGDYDNPDEPGEVSHFQALASALSATIGLGNIAGVAIAVSLGGPGAIFWMIVAGVLGMSAKFAECTLSQMYRKVSPDGTVSGGPMHYLYAGLKKIQVGPINLGPLGFVLSLVFTVLCIGGSFGGGCAFQVRQSLGPIREKLPFLEGNEWMYGLLMVIMVGLVIIGGIRRIAATAEKIVPTMCCVYVMMALYVLAVNFREVDNAVALIFSEAFKLESAWGGFVAVMVVGIRRAGFSNEAGSGSAAIAHAAAKTEEPVREGIVASLGPFIDTVVICTMTGLVIVITGVYDKANPQYAELIANKEGAALTSLALGSAHAILPWILCMAVFLFAYSTMISWSYYGERCWSHLFGQRLSMVYKVMFLVAVMLGSIINAGNVLEFSDLMILSMALPNILGVILMSGKIRLALNDYWGRYMAGEMEPYRGKGAK